MIEFFKCLYVLSASIMKEIFTKRVSNHNLPNFRVTLLLNTKTKNYGIGTIVYNATQTWSILPAEYKNLSSLNFFRVTFSDCPWNICQNFFWWRRFNELKLRAIAKICCYLSISNYSDCVLNLLGEFLFWSFEILL